MNDTESSEVRELDPLPKSTDARVESSFWDNESMENHALAFIESMRGRMEALMQGRVSHV